MEPGQSLEIKHIHFYAIRNKVTLSEINKYSSRFVSVHQNLQSNEFATDLFLKNSSFQRFIDFESGNPADFFLVLKMFTDLLTLIYIYLYLSYKENVLLARY